MEAYSEQVLQLKEEIRKSSRLPGRRMERLLSALLKEAKALQDDALLGYVYFYYADRYYFMRPDYPAFRRNLKKSIHHLLQTDDRERLGFSYNLVAIDAHNSGNYTIAYHYYLAARRLGAETRQSLLLAGVSANIGRLLTSLGYYDLAENYLAESLDEMPGAQSSPMFLRNMIIINYLRGSNCLFRKKKRDAQGYLSKMKQYMAMQDEAAAKAFRLPYLFLQARIFVSSGENEALTPVLREMAAIFEREPVLYDYMEDIFYLCNPLLEESRLDEVKKLIDRCVGKIEHCGITHVERLFFELRLKYDQAAGHKNKVFDDLRELNERLIRQTDEQNERSLHAIELSSIMTDLRTRNKQTIRENEILKQQADTDALTGLPNRYAMNDMLDEVFERSCRSKKTLCIGILDVDYFKEYNDTYGHQAGDVCLNAIAGSLRKLSAGKDVFCARYGGDEFVIICENTDQKRAAEIARTLNEDISSCMIRHKLSHISDFVTVSQGYCCDIPDDGMKIWDYLAEADKALYAVKKARGTSPAGSSVRIESLRR